MSSDANNQAKVLQFAAFGDHGWGYVAMYPRCPHVLLTKLCQPFHNDVIPTVKELSDIVWRNIRALIYDLNQFIYNFKSHALL